MSPVLRIPFGSGGLELGAYSTFYLLAWVVAPVLSAVVAWRAGLGFRRALGVFGGAMAAGIVGARIFDLGIAWHFYAEEPSRILGLAFQGFSLYGGLLVATATGIALAWLARVDVWRLADAAVAGLVVGVVLMRTGCFLRGCCFGVETDAVWGVVYPLGSPAWEFQVAAGRLGLLAALGEGAAHPVHPTQLYEMLAAVVLGVLAWVVARTGQPRGVPFLVFATGFTAFRLANGFLRERQQVISAPGWFYPAFYSALMAVMVVLIARRYREARRERAAEAALYP